jgi:two-component system response regulator
MRKPILLSVEDSDAEFQLIKMAVEDSGVAVVLLRACDGEEALQFLTRGPGHETAPRPHLILLDVNLPKRNGFDVLAEIRGTEELCSLPVVMFTSSSSANEKRKALALGANDFISKPMALEDLSETVGAVVKKFLLE